MCNHTFKTKSVNVTVPIVNENGILALNSHRGASIPVNSVIYCSNKICERIFDYVPLNGKRIEKVEFGGVI